MTWSFESTPRSTAKVDNHDAVVLIEPRGDGTWQVRLEGAPAEDAVGRYPTVEAARRAVSATVLHVKIVEPKIEEKGAAVPLIARSLNSRLAEAEAHLPSHLKPTA